MNPTVPTDAKLFFSKNDPSDVRLGDLARPVSIDQLPSQGFAILGYPDDEGIKKNGGRLGAKLGPDSIRDRLYRMTPAYDKTTQPMPLWDLGNLDLLQLAYPTRHIEASQIVQSALKNGLKWIGLGGGHDYGFTDGHGFLSHHSQSPIKPLVVNFDAHLDVRPLIDGTMTSGTPFRRLLELHSKKFDFVEVGIQKFCNSSTHYQWLKSQGGHTLCLDEIRNLDGNLKDRFRDQLDQWGFLIPGRPCYLSIDIDAFQASSAMGCSQSWPSGLTPSEFFSLFELLCHIFSVSTLGIYEVSPPLDQDQQTAKLAAEIIHRFYSL